MSGEYHDQPVPMVQVPVHEMETTFVRLLEKAGMETVKARRCAAIFTANSIDGVYSHGVNRFPRFVEYIRNGYVQPNKEPERTGAVGMIEQWDGRLGPGPLNAVMATERAMALARENGMGCVALANTNHWMRGGYYGWQAAQKGFVFIGWTNTIANMPAWKATENRLGNNPLVIAVPYQGEAVVLDMALSQYSFGAIEQAALQGRPLEVDGGYDTAGHLSRDPAAIRQSQKALPAGYWKGTGLALLLDILATILSGGQSTAAITEQGTEYGVSQVFMAIHISSLPNYPVIEAAIEQILADYHHVPVVPGEKIVHPGERILRTRKQSREKGIPVVQSVWDAIKAL